MTNSLKQLLAKIPVDRVNNMVDSMHNSMNEPRLGYITDYADPVHRLLHHGNRQDIQEWPDDRKPGFCTIQVKNCNC